MVRERLPEHYQDNEHAAIWTGGVVFNVISLVIKIIQGYNYRLLAKILGNMEGTTLQQEWGMHHRQECLSDYDEGISQH